MGSLSNTLEGSSGTTVSNANSAGPNQFNTVSITGTGTTLAYDTAHVHAGATAAKVSLATVSSTAYLDWSSLPNTPTANAFVRAYFYLTALPSVSAVLLKFLSGASVEASVQLQSSGLARTLTTAGGTISTLTESFPLNQWVRVEFEVTGISGVNGTVAARIFSGANLEGTTPDTGGSVSASSAALTGTVTDLRVGTSSAVTQTSAFTYWLDDVAYSDVATPGAAHPAPVVITAPPAQVAPARPAAPQVITAPVSGAAAGTASLAGAGAVTDVVTQAVTASVAAAGAVSATVTQAVTANLAGAGAVNATGSAGATATIAGAGSVTAVATVIVTASLAGAGALTAAVVTAQAPAGALVTVTQPRPPPGPPPRPQILPPVQQDFLVVLGDMQPAQHTTAPPTVVAAQIAALNPQPVFALIAGDCTNDGDNTGFTGEFTNFDSMYGGIKGILRPVPGNHDWGNVVGSGNLTAYDTYWGGQAHSGATPPHFYSFDTPTGWHVVALDSDEQWVGSLGNPSATYTALAADLAANRGKPLLAYWHHPRWSDGTNTTDPGGTGDTTTVQDIWNLLRDYACDLVFTGHCHSYQRFPKLGKTGTADSGGIREFVVGTGGSGLFTLTAAPGAGARSDVNSWQSAAYDQLNSQWFGFLKLYLTPSTYSWQFVSQNAAGSQNPGAVLDSGGPVPTNLSLGAVQPGGLGSAAPAGAGAVSANVTQIVTASLAGAGAVATAVTQAAGAALAGAGAVTDVVTEAVTASLAGAGSVTASVAGAGSTASLTGAGAVTANVTEAATAAPAGAGAVTAAAAQAAKAVLAGAGSLTAAGQITGTAGLAGAGAVTAKTGQGVTAAAAGAGAMAATAVQAAVAALTGAGSVAAVSSTQLAFTVGTLTAADKPAATQAPADKAASALGAATAPSGALTAGDQRTGGPS